MEFTNEFAVPTDMDTAWGLLTDLERVAPCLPGAELDEVDGDVYSGSVKVKVGPMTMTYRGTAQLVEADREAGRARIEAAGREAKGGGSAKANITAQLTEQGDETLVNVVTELDVTGKPAQFGRGVLADVGTKIIGAFAERLEKLVTDEGAATTGDGGATESAGTVDEGSASAEQTATMAATPAPATSDPRPAPARAENEALNLMEVAGGAALKRLLPVVGVVVVAALLIWWLVR